MNDQIKAEVLSWLKEIAAAVKAGADFIGQQAPLVVQEKVSYARIDYTAWFTVGAIMLIAGVVLFFKAVKVSQRVDERWNWSNQKMSDFWMRMGPAIPLLFIGFFAFFATADTVLMVWFAPRVYILEWLMNGAK
jgi:heme/copper-type cytochrome/quinol oxidase subunit 2